MKSDIVNVNSGKVRILLQTQFGKLRWVKKKISKGFVDLILQQQITKLYVDGEVEEKYIDVVVVDEKENEESI